MAEFENPIYMNRPIETPWDEYPWRADTYTVYWWQPVLDDLAEQGLIEPAKAGEMGDYLENLVIDYHNRYEANPDDPEFEDGYLPLYRQIDDYLEENLTQEAQDEMHRGVNEHLEQWSTL